MNPASPMHDERLRKTSIIRSRSEFGELFRTGKRVYGKYIFIIYKSYPEPAEPETPCRIAFVAGKRVGNAVKRNRYKRRLREIFRKHPSVFFYYQALIVAQATIGESDYDALAADVLAAAKQMKPS